MRPHPLASALLEDYKGSVMEVEHNPDNLEAKAKKERLYVSIKDNYARYFTPEQKKEFEYYSNPEYFKG